MQRNHFTSHLILAAIYKDLFKNVCKSIAARNHKMDLTID
jgi:hypothetical protein